MIIAKTKLTRNELDSRLISTPAAIGVIKQMEKKLPKSNVKPFIHKVLNVFSGFPPKYMASNL